MKNSLILLLFLPLNLMAETRVGDITGIRGIDENFLQGYGVVGGLNGKGDKGSAVKRLAQKILSTYGSEFDENDLEARNMAIVHVTANLKPFARPGQRFDVNVVAQGAESLEGGILLSCHLYLSGTNPETTRPLAIAQGSILVGNTGQVGRGDAAGGSASIPTVGSAIGGGVLLREVPQNYLKVSYDKSDQPVAKWIEFVLDRPNFTNASEIAKAINDKFARELINFDLEEFQETSIATSLSAGEVMVTIPRPRWGNIIDFISTVQRIPLNHVESDVLVVVNEKTNTFTTSGDIKLNACTVSYNQVNITIVKDQDLSQVVQQLSAVLTTKDIIEVIKTLHSAGHLRAELKVE